MCGWPARRSARKRSSSTSSPLGRNGSAMAAPVSKETAAQSSSPISASSTSPVGGAALSIAASRLRENASAAVARRMVRAVLFISQLLALKFDLSRIIIGDVGHKFKFRLLTAPISSSYVQREAIEGASGGGRAGLVLVCCRRPVLYAARHLAADRGPREARRHHARGPREPRREAHRCGADARGARRRGDRTAGRCRG